MRSSPEQTPNKIVIVIDMPQDLGRIAELFRFVGDRWPDVPVEAPGFGHVAIDRSDTVIQIPGLP